MVVGGDACNGFYGEDVLSVDLSRRTCMDCCLWYRLHHFSWIDKCWDELSGS
jgi:hypothetical protein